MLFSVIVPIYRVEAFLHKCVDSILTQTFGDFELILVDDGSPDGCGAICDEYARADARVRVIHKPNGGVVSARNAGLDVVTGEYVCYVDGDDWVAKNWLETIKNQIEAASVRPDLVVFGAVKVFEDRTEPLVHNLENGFYDRERLKWEVYPYLINDRRFSAMQSVVCMSLWNKAFKSPLAREHYCRDERIALGEDFAISVECFLNAQSIAVCDDVLYCYNQMNTGSLMTAYNPNRFKAYRLLFQYLREQFAGKSKSIDTQLNTFFANCLASSVRHEVECHRTINEAARHIARELDATGVLEFVTLRGLPFHAWVFIMLLRLRLYRLAYLGTKLKLKLK